MPKPSTFIKDVRHYGMKPQEFGNSSSPIDLQFHVLELGPRSGKGRDELLAQLRGGSTQTLTLLRAPMPSPRSSIDSRSLRCSSYVRIVIWSRSSRYGKPEELQALVHAEYSLRAPVDFDPDMVWLEGNESTSPMVMTIRVIDVHFQQDQQSEYLTECLGWALSDQLFAHLNDLTIPISHCRDDGYGFENYQNLFRFEIQSDVAFSKVANVINAAESFFREACASAEPRHEVHEWLYLQNGVDLRQTDVDADFQDAVEQFLSGRKSLVKPKPERAAPNGIHHLLLCTDPVLRLSHGKVVNLSRLAAMQAAAHERRHEMIESDELDENQVDWGPDYEDRLEAMKQNPNLSAIKWVFLVDDGTQVFASLPIPVTELTLDKIQQFMDSAWRGEHGLLRGPPQAVSLPAAYTTEAARQQLGEHLSKRGVTLEKPKSGFATPLHLARLWCQASSEMRSANRETATPASVSFDYVREWALAHALSEHANSHFSGTHDWVQRFNFDAGSYPSMKSIKVGSYMAALNLSGPIQMFRQWQSRCHPRFRPNLRIHEGG